MTLYHQIHAWMPTPVVVLNRAIAIGETDGPEAALEALDGVSGLDDYHLLHATRGAMLDRLGRSGAARSVYETAVDLAVSDRDKRLLARRIADIA